MVIDGSDGGCSNESVLCGDGYSGGCQGCHGTEVLIMTVIERVVIGGCRGNSFDNSDDGSCYKGS